MFRTYQGTPDLYVFTTTVALLSIGVVMVFSASSVTALNETGDALYFAKRQLAFALIGIVAMLTLMRLDYHVYRRFALPGVLVGLLVLVLVLIVGREIGGSKRWIPLGIVNLQASEVAKLALLNFTAAYAASRQSDMQSFVKGILPPLAILGLYDALIMLEPDFGTAVTMAATTMLLLFSAGAHILHLFLVGLAALPLAALLIYLEPYRLRRLLAFIDPWADPADSGWNIIQSLLAIGSGGLFGFGLGQGREKFFYLPAPHTDFIFAILGEEFGFIGTSTVVLLFLVFAWRGCRIALQAPDRYGCILATGITLMITFQAFLNIGVVTGSLPVTGIPLPLISSGGSSLVINLAGIGILLNISRWTRESG